MENLWKCVGEHVFVGPGWHINSAGAAVKDDLRGGVECPECAQAGKPVSAVGAAVAVLLGARDTTGQVDTTGLVVVPTSQGPRVYGVHSAVAEDYFRTGKPVA